MTDRSKTVVMLIDWDNLQICHSRDAPGTELDLQALIALAQSYGTLVSARAYAEWNLLSERLAVYKAGIEPVFAPVMRPEGSPREGKSLADTVMVADGVDLLWTVAPDVFVLATSDKDMIPLARIAKQRGAAVVVLGSDLTAIPLVEMSNVFITYRQLLRELDRVSELEAPVGRAPARERRLRESRRPSSEPYGGGLGSGTLAPGPIGVGARPPARPAGLAAPIATPIPPPPSRPPRRRIIEDVSAPIEPERIIPAPAPIAPSIAPSPFPIESAEDEVGSELAPRRRRRRGGRGRRTGLGSAGDVDLQGESLQDVLDDADDGDGTDIDVTPAVAFGSTPDDIDNAVLQLLASRDRESTPEATSEAGIDESDPLAPAPAATVVETRPPAPRRVARTSFSSFGPPDVPIRPAAYSPPPAAPEQPAEPVADGQSAAPPAADTGSVTQGLAPDAVISQALPVEPIAGEPFPQLAPTPADEPPEGVNIRESVEDSATAQDSAPAESAARPPRTRRSTRSGSGSRSRRPASGSTTANGTTASANDEAGSGSPEAASEDGESASRAPRRRRTRRPAVAETVTSEDSA